MDSTNLTVEFNSGIPIILSISDLQEILNSSKSESYGLWIVKKIELQEISKVNFSEIYSEYMANSVHSNICWIATKTNAPTLLASIESVLLFPQLFLDYEFYHCPLVNVSTMVDSYRIITNFIGNYTYSYHSRYGDILERLGNESLYNLDSEEMIQALLDNGLSGEMIKNFKSISMRELYRLPIGGMKKTYLTNTDFYSFSENLIDKIEEINQGREEKISLSSIELFDHYLLKIVQNSSTEFEKFFNDDCFRAYRDLHYSH